jgi:hypothetical protein
MDNINTFSSVTEWLRKLATEQEVISPDTWIRGAVKLNVLLEKEVEKLIAMEFAVANMRKDLLSQGNSAVYCRMMIEASEEYRDVQVQKAKISNANETIKLAKRYAQLSSDQLRSGL